MNRRQPAGRSNLSSRRLPHPYRIGTTRNFSPTRKIGKFELAFESHPEALKVQLIGLSLDDFEWNQRSVAGSGASPLHLVPGFRAT